MPGSPCRPRTSLTIVAPALSAASATAGFIVSMERSAPLSFSASMTGMTRRNSSSALTGVAPLRVEFAADVEDGRAFARQPQTLRNRRVGIEEQPAVGEGIRRDVDDAHHQRRARDPAAAPAAKQIGKSAAEISPAACICCRDAIGAGARPAARREQWTRVSHRENDATRLDVSTNGVSWRSVRLIRAAATMLSNRL